MKLIKKTLGINIRWEMLLLGLIIAGFAWCHWVGGCLTREGMENAGAAIDYVMSKGVHNNKYESKYDQVSTNGGSALSPQVPLPEGQLFFWANNEFSGKCCDTSNVSNGAGCACITSEQACYLNSRGGNRASPSEF